MKQFSVEYLGGHPIYMKKDSGELRVDDSEISFWSGRFSKQQKFSVSLTKIKKVEVQEQNKITLTRALVLGMASLIFKKKKKFLVLYFDVAGLESGAIFDFPKDSGDKRKTEMMQTILMAKDKLTVNTDQTTKTPQSISEKEIIREKVIIIKTRCAYCNNVYDETIDKCPHCGAKH